MIDFNILPFPNLISERLLYRKITNDDVVEILALRGNPETMKYIPRPLAKNLDDALQHIKTINDAQANNDGITWAVTFKNSNKLIGLLGYYRTQHSNFRSEIGYMFLPEYYGQGIASEAVNTIMGFGFEQLNFHSIEAIIDPENIASEKVLIKNNFTKEAHFKENFYYEGKFLDAVHYGILKSNFTK